MPSTSRRHVLRSHQCRRRAAGPHADVACGTTTTAFRCLPSTRPPKADISEILAGFQRDERRRAGLRDFHGKRLGLRRPVRHLPARRCASAAQQHVPVLIHVTEVTQPQGHCTSGSHERYKTKDRLAWEEEFDCLHKMREWLLSNGHATEEELDEIENGSQGSRAQGPHRCLECLLRPHQSRARRGRASCSITWRPKPAPERAARHW